CRWSRTGRARSCERELASEGIHAFATPNQVIEESHKFYRWMHNGTDLYRLFMPHYRLFDVQHSTSYALCFDTFPHAIACALAKDVLRAKDKRADRPKLLRDAGLSLEFLENIDMVDAALCALTAHHMLAGTIKTYGDAQEGFIVVPHV